jgi:hypothetical protein
MKPLQQARTGLIEYNKNITKQEIKFNQALIHLMGNIVYDESGNAVIDKETGTYVIDSEYLEQMANAINFIKN